MLEGVDVLRYYYGSKIDAQGRIHLGIYAADMKKVVFSIEEGREDYVFVEAYDPNIGLPPNCARSVDSKNRVCMPKWLINGYNRVLIGKDGDQLILRLIKE